MSVVDRSRMREGQCPVDGCGACLDYGEFVATDVGGYYKAKCPTCGAKMMEIFRLEFDSYEDVIEAEPSPVAMDTGKALEIVHGMAKQLLREHGELCGPGTCLHNASTALDTVEDLIVNNFKE
jgi:hypothetical protein